MEAMNDDQMSVSEITWQHVRGRTSYDEGGEYKRNGDIWQ